MVPGKFSPAVERQPPIVTGPRPIGFPPVPNDPVCVAPDETVRSVNVMIDVALDCDAVRTYGVLVATEIVAGSDVVFAQLQ